MTDTTDIAALREGLIELLDHVDSYGGKCWLFPEDVRLIISLLDKLDVAEKKNALVAGGIEEALKMQEQLEAERQRADAAHKYGSERDAENESLMLTVGRLRAEIAALKTDIESYISINGELATEVEALKAKLANPVVLGSSDVMSRNFAVKAIIAAGFTVKGYLPTEQLVFEGVRP